MAAQPGAAAGEDRAPTAAAQTLPSEDSLTWRVATVARCGCGSDVLRVSIDYLPVAVERTEIECPTMICPLCKGQKNKRGDCLRCGGLGRVGEPIPARAVAVNERGQARAWFRGLSRVEGEGLYRRHQC